MQQPDSRAERGGAGVQERNAASANENNTGRRISGRPGRGQAAPCAKLPKLDHGASDQARLLELALPVGAPRHPKAGPRCYQPYVHARSKWKTASRTPSNARQSAHVAWSLAVAVLHPAAYMQTIEGRTILPCHHVWKAHAGAEHRQLLSPENTCRLRQPHRDCA